MGSANCSCKKDQITEGIIVDTDSRKPKSGFRVVIHKIKDYSPLHPIRVLCALTEEGIVILDENGFKCTFYTSYYQPGKKSISVSDSPDQFTDKAIGNEITFNEEASFARNLQWILDNQSIKRDLYVSFQLLQRNDAQPNDTEMSVDEIVRMSVQSNASVSSFPRNSTSARNSVSKNRLIGWVLFKRNTQKNKIMDGRFTAKFLKPPLVRPPFPAGTALTPTNIKIEFSIN